MNFYLAFVLLFASFVAAADQPASCKTIDTTRYLDPATVQDCFENTTFPQEAVDAIYRTLEVVGGFYPYVDIDLNPPNPDDMPGYFPTLNYTEELLKLGDELDHYDGYLPSVVRPTQKFIAQFHDGHFSLRFYENVTKNSVSKVAALLPFQWNLQNDDEETASVHISTTTLSNVFLDADTVQMIQGKAANNIAVASVDFVDAYEYFTTFFGPYNDMKSHQGALQYSKYIMANGFPILSAPLENGILFGNHTLIFDDGDSFYFTLGFINPYVEQSRRDVDGITEKALSPLIAPASRLSEDEVLRIVLNAAKDLKYSRMNRRDGSKNKFVQCTTVNKMNVMSVGTFGPENVETYVYELAGCIGEFDQNDYPISVVLPLNGGGYLLLEELLEMLLMPNSDYRMIAAIRKTDVSKHIAVEYEDGVFAQEFSDVDKGCKHVKDAEKFWKETVVDDLGNGVKHTRTKKYFLAYREELQEAYAECALHDHIRKPTDIVIATDGFCFSACSIFVYNCLRTGSAIVSGYGATNPGDTLFVAAQCPSSVIPPAELFDELEDDLKYGLSFQATFFESYTISSKDPVIPGDFEIWRIDKHTGFNESVGINIRDMVPYLKAVQEEYQESCNPHNKRLFLVDNCTVEDPNARDTGYPCGENGQWDKSQCKIFTCAKGYYVDFDNNTCVENKCDIRVEDSSAMVHPIAVLIVAVACILAYFTF